MDRRTARWTVVSLLQSPVIAALLLLANWSRVEESAASLVAWGAIGVVVLSMIWVGLRHGHVVSTAQARAALPAACAALGWSARAPRRVVRIRRVMWASVLGVVVIVLIGRIATSERPALGALLGAAAVLALAVVVVADAAFARRRFVQTFAGGQFAFEPLLDPLPAPLAQRAGELEDLGFHEVARVRMVAGKRPQQLFVHLLRPDGVVGIAYTQPPGDAAFLALRSMLGDHAGILGTESVQGGLSATNDITQVFPGEVAAELVAHHGAALAHLASAGVVVRPIADDEVMPFVEWAARNAGRHYPEGASGLLRLVAKSFGRVDDRGPVTTHARTSEKLAVVKAAM